MAAALARVMPEIAANILLVDDKSERLLTYEVMLEPLGQRLVRANSGRKALSLLEDMDFAAILLDVNMPGMDGFEVASQIRRQGRQTPIIFVTGVHMTDLDQMKGYEVGAADYVYVPVVPDILRGKVQVLVQLYLQRAELSRLNAQLRTANADLKDAHAKLEAENTRELQKLNWSLSTANAQLLSEVKERRRIEELLRDAARRKDEFISILSHELRNPLAVIHTAIELLRQPSMPQEQLNWSREILERQVKHLVRLIDDLLDVSRITTGRVELRRENVDLRKIVQQSLDDAKPAIAAQRHTVTLSLPDTPVMLYADAVRISQVCVNLIENAAKYTRDEGNIWLSVEADPNAENAVLRVRDSGVGLRSEMLERVFDLFEQAELPTDRNKAGLGIGLSLVRGLVDLHGGSVRAFSDGADQGSEFVVELPRQRSADVPVKKRGVTSPRSTAPLRLLIIDDNVDAADGLALQFRSISAHEVELAYTGSSGVAAALEFAPDVVLLDIGLPDIDGYEVARRLRAHECMARIPLIAMTGFGGAPDRARAEAAGFDHFMVKPVAYRDLQDLVARCACA
jgi:signal transduction histidine kinase